MCYVYCLFINFVHNRLQVRLLCILSGAMDLSLALSYLRVMRDENMLINIHIIGW